MVYGAQTKMTINDVAAVLSLLRTLPPQSPFRLATPSLGGGVLVILYRMLGPHSTNSIALVIME